ncbi:hypothetical protein A2U01_0085918, partial [Trifolium medium]|nr:hypothetical protein [Trifolium medium]
DQPFDTQSTPPEMEIWDKMEVVEIAAYTSSPPNTTILGCCSRHWASKNAS